MTPSWVVQERVAAHGVAKFNGKATLRGREARDVCITIHDVHVCIALDLPANLKKDLRYDRLVKGDPKSRMRLTIKSNMSGNDRFAWDDSDDDKIENHIAEIVAKIVVSAELQVRDQAHSHHAWWLQRRENILEQRRLAREEAERKRVELLEHERQARIEMLLSHSTALHQADQIRTLVERATASYPTRDSVALNEWAAWALNVADDLDPIKSGKVRTTTGA